MKLGADRGFFVDRAASLLWPPGCFVLKGRAEISRIFRKPRRLCCTRGTKPRRLSKNTPSRRLLPEGPPVWRSGCKWSRLRAVRQKHGRPQRRGAPAIARACSACLVETTTATSTSATSDEGGFIITTPVLYFSDQEPTTAGCADAYYRIKISVGGKKA
jgi:hypothetical protein